MSETKKPKTRYSATGSIATDWFVLAVSVILLSIVVVTTGSDGYQRIAANFGMESGAMAQGSATY